MADTAIPWPRPARRTRLPADPREADQWLADEIDDHEAANAAQVAALRNDMREVVAGQKRTFWTVIGLIVTIIVATSTVVTLFGGGGT